MTVALVGAAPRSGTTLMRSMLCHMLCHAKKCHPAISGDRYMRYPVMGYEECLPWRGRHGRHDVHDTDDMANVCGGQIGQYAEQLFTRWSGRDDGTLEHECPGSSHVSPHRGKPVTEARIGTWREDITEEQGRVIRGHAPDPVPLFGHGMDDETDRKSA